MRFVFFFALPLLAWPLRAQDLVFRGNSPRASLIELYSSEGCSSCPPAEAWLGDLKTSPGLWKTIFPAAFHVDYWDGLGWPDPLARPAFTQRQRDYAAHLGQESVYTPEFVANGREWRHSTGLLEQAMTGELTLTAEGKDPKISAHYASPAPLAGETLTLNVALLGFGLVTDVQRGENSGRTLRHDFVVLGFRSVPLQQRGETYLTDPATIENPTGEKAAAVAAWVTRPDGAILQIAGGWLSADKRSDQATSAAALVKP